MATWKLDRRTGAGRSAQDVQGDRPRTGGAEGTRRARGGTDARATRADPAWCRATRSARAPDDPMPSAATAMGRGEGRARRREDRRRRCPPRWKRSTTCCARKRKSSAARSCGSRQTGRRRVQPRAAGSLDAVRPRAAAAAADQLRDAEKHGGTSGRQPRRPRSTGSASWRGGRSSSRVSRKTWPANGAPERGRDEATARAAHARAIGAAAAGRRAVAADGPAAGEPAGTGRPARTAAGRRRSEPRAGAGWRSAGGAERAAARAPRDSRRVVDRSSARPRRRCAAPPATCGGRIRGRQARAPAGRSSSCDRWSGSCRALSPTSAAAPSATCSSRRVSSQSGSGSWRSRPQPLRAPRAPTTPGAASPAIRTVSPTG